MPDSEVLIFVDVDGVLNVGCRDPGRSPIPLEQGNVDVAESLLRGNPSSPCKCAERIIAVCKRPLEHGEDGTFSDFICTSPTDITNIFVERLATLITAAGENCKVILSSTWRLPNYQNRRKMLESILAKYLNKPFTFDDITDVRVERTPAERIVSIGNYVAQYCHKRSSSQSLRVVVLEDLFVTGLHGWSLEGTVVSDETAIEQYLECRAFGVNVTARFVHTYHEFISAKGLLTQIGCGLTAEHMCRAGELLGIGCAFCGRTESTSDVSDPDPEPQVGAAEPDEEPLPMEVPTPRR